MNVALILALAASAMTNGAGKAAKLPKDVALVIRSVEQQDAQALEKRFPSVSLLTWTGKKSALRHTEFVRRLRDCRAGDQYNAKGQLVLAIDCPHGSGSADRCASGDYFLAFPATADSSELVLKERTRMADLCPVYVPPPPERKNNG